MVGVPASSTSNPVQVTKYARRPLLFWVSLKYFGGGSARKSSCSINNSPVKGIARTVVRILRVVDSLDFVNLTFRPVGNDKTQWVENSHLALSRCVEMLPHKRFEQLNLMAAVCRDTPMYEQNSLMASAG